MIFDHPFANGNGVFRTPNSGKGFGERHKGKTVVMLGVFGANLFEQRGGFGGLVLAQQALAKMRAGVYVLRVPGQSGAVTFLGFGQLALLKINVAKLVIKMRFVQVMDLGLQFLDAAAVKGAGQFESPRRGRT